jgi:asparagine synthetase B (glutamine-hydrolysing)
MCGISGVFSSYGNPTIEHTVDRMIKSLRHRGPDNIGIWVSENERCGLGHARLSIIDLSPVSNQPMHYLNRYVLVFNGEIYNYLELK